MDMQLSDTERQLAESARKLAQDTLAAGASERERAHAISHDIIRALGSEGLLGVNIPRCLGGREAGVVAYVLALREVAEVDASVAVTMAVSSMVAEVIYKFGTEEQRRRYVPKITSGEYFGGAFALSEQNAGSDAAAITTRAERHGQRWVIRGEKMWITTGDEAGVLVVWARTGSPGPKGITCFLVERGAPGLTAHKPEEKMGIRASHTVALTFDGVEVGEDARLGEVGGGFPIAMTALDGGRIGISAQSCGIGRAALDAALSYVRERNQFGRPICDFQAIQFKLADMATELDAAFLLTLRAAWLKGMGRAFSKEAAMSKMRASESANRIVREAMQMHGGYGYLEDSLIARLYRDCRVTQIYEGTSEIQRVVVGRAVANSDVL